MDNHGGIAVIYAKHYILKEHGMSVVSSRLICWEVVFTIHDQPC